MYPVNGSNYQVNSSVINSEDTTRFSDVKISGFVEIPFAPIGEFETSDLKEDWVFEVYEEKVSREKNFAHNKLSQKEDFISKMTYCLGTVKRVYNSCLRKPFTPAKLIVKKNSGREAEAEEFIHGYFNLLENSGTSNSASRLFSQLLNYEYGERVLFNDTLHGIPRQQDLHEMLTKENVDYIAIPMVTSRNMVAFNVLHSTVIFIDKQNKTIEYYDALADRPENRLFDTRGEQSVKYLLISLQSEIKDLYNEEYTIVDVLETSSNYQQNDSHNCGIYSMLYVNKRLEQKSFESIKDNYEEFDTSIVTQYRREIAEKSKNMLMEMDLVKEEDFGDDYEMIDLEELVENQEENPMLPF